MESVGEDMLLDCECVKGEGDDSKAGLGISWGVELPESSGGKVMVSSWAWGCEAVVK